jgi:hypothetical protein
METRPLKVLVSFEDSLMASIIAAEKAKPKARDEKAATAKPRRIGSKTWDYTGGRYLAGDR